LIIRLQSTESAVYGRPTGHVADLLIARKLEQAKQEGASPTEVAFFAERGRGGNSTAGQVRTSAFIVGSLDRFRQRSEFSGQGKEYEASFTSQPVQLKPRTGEMTSA
jgi:hypothetical protein